LRIEYEGAVYHITSRGNARERIFLDDEDRNVFLAEFRGHEKARGQTFIFESGSPGDVSESARFAKGDPLDALLVTGLVSASLPRRRKAFGSGGLPRAPVVD
jgi:hypothetical protein